MRTACSVFAILFVAAFAAAQKTPAPLVEQIEVQVTNVDVVVTDRAGHPVTGLSRDEFEIFEDGVPQTITNFYAIQDATVRLAKHGDEEGSIVPDQFRRKVVLLIDDNFIPKPARDAALTRLDEFIDSHATPNCAWTVVAIGRNVETIQPFTSDKKAIHAAIDHVRHMPTFAEQRNMDRDILSDPLRRDATKNEFTADDSFGRAVRFKSREQTMRNLRATLNTARAVVQACRAFSASEGKKVAILVTGGMEMNTTFRAYDTEDDRVLSDMKRETEQTLDMIVREANAANVNLYVINARNRTMTAPQHDVANKSSGINPGQGSLEDAVGAGPIDTTDIDTSSRILAMGTGGLYLPANNVASSLERIDEETSSYYSLGFSPQSHDEGVYHHIDVKVKRPGLDVRSRQGFVNVSVDERLEESLLAPLTFPREQGSLPVKLVLGIPEGKNNALVLPVTAELPMRLLTIVPHGSTYAGRVHIYLSIYDGAGNNVGYHHFIRDLTVRRDEYASVPNSIFHYHGMLQLKPGAFTVVVTLRDDVSNEIGTASEFVRL